MLRFVFVLNNTVDAFRWLGKGDKHRPYASPSTRGDGMSHSSSISLGKRVYGTLYCSQSAKLSGKTMVISQNTFQKTSQGERQRAFAVGRSSRNLAAHS